MWGQLASLAIGALGASKQRKSARRAEEAAVEAADLAYERSQPWDVQGAFGQATYDLEGKQLTMGLSEPWQSEYDIAMAGAGEQRAKLPGIQAEYDRQRALAAGQEGGYATQMARVGGAQADYDKQMGLISGSEADYATQRGYAAQLEGDPMAAGKKFYDMQKAIFAPEQEKDRLALESRLLSQGMLGSTGGAGRQEALRKAQSQQDLEAQYAGLDKAQQMISTYRGRAGEEQAMIDAYRGRGREAQAQEDVYRGRAGMEDARVGMFRGRANEEQAMIDSVRARGATDLGMAETIGQLPQKYAQTGSQQGANLASIAGAAGKMQSSAAQAGAASQSNIYGKQAGQFKDLVGNWDGSGMFGGGQGYQGSYEPWGNQGGFEFEQGGPEWWTQP